MYEPSEEPRPHRRRAAQEAAAAQEQTGREYDWDQWERSSPRRYRFWIWWMVAMIVLLTILYFSGNSPWN